MLSASASEISRLIRQLRENAGLTQARLAELVGTTQSVISRLESDNYEGHSLSMLYRIAAALNRKIAVQAVGDEPPALSVREASPFYGFERVGADVGHDTVTGGELERFVKRLAQRLGERGVAEADVREAVRWASSATTGRSVAELRGAINVERGDVVKDVRRARAQRGSEWATRS